MPTQTLATVSVAAVLASINDSARAFVFAKRDDLRQTAKERLERAAANAIEVRELMSINARRTMRDQLYESLALWQRKGNFHPDVPPVINRVYLAFKA